MCRFGELPAARMMGMIFSGFASGLRKDRRTRGRKLRGWPRFGARFASLGCAKAHPYNVGAHHTAAHIAGGGFALPGCGNRNKMRAAIDPFVCTRGASHNLRGEPTNCVAYPFSYHRAKSLAEASKLLQELGRRVSRAGGGTKPDSIDEDCGWRGGRNVRWWTSISFKGLSGIQSHKCELRFGSTGASYGYRNVRGSGSNSDFARLRGGNCGCAVCAIKGRLADQLAVKRIRVGDWGATLLTAGDFGYVRESAGERTIKLEDFIKDAFTTVLWA